LWLVCLFLLVHFSPICGYVLCSARLLVCLVVVFGWWGYLCFVWGKLHWVSKIFLSISNFYSYGGILWCYSFMYCLWHHWVYMLMVGVGLSFNRWCCYWYILDHVPFILVMDGFMLRLFFGACVREGLACGFKFLGYWVDIW